MADLTATAPDPGLGRAHDPVDRTVHLNRTRAYAIVVAACALPRLGVLLHERDAILSNFEKSQLLAQMFLHDGTFGYVPGHPSAYTQPLYGFFLIPVFWIGGFHWWSVGTAQLLVAIATSLVVFETGRRFLSPRIGLIGAVVATLQPYLVWHDLHGNREILDQLLGAALFGLTLARRLPPHLWPAAALGVVGGLAILSNARLAAPARRARRCSCSGGAPAGSRRSPFPSSPSS